MSETFKLDTTKLPLGQLSKAQLQKGMAVLNDLGKELGAGKRAAVINELSSQVSAPGRPPQLTVPYLQSRD